MVFLSIPQTNIIVAKMPMLVASVADEREKMILEDIHAKIMKGVEKKLALSILKTKQLQEQANELRAWRRSD